jgi:hypothetical protein
VSNPVSGGEARPALRAACLYHFPSVTGGHAGAKAMGTGTLHGARLKCSFHYRFLIFREACNLNKRAKLYIFRVVRSTEKASWFPISLWITRVKRSRLAFACLSTGGAQEIARPETRGSARMAHLRAVVARQ